MVLPTASVSTLRFTRPCNTARESHQPLAEHGVNTHNRTVMTLAARKVASITCLPSSDVTNAGGGPGTRASTTACAATRLVQCAVTQAP